MPPAALLRAHMPACLDDLLMIWGWEWHCTCLPTNTSQDSLHSHVYNLYSEASCVCKTRIYVQAYSRLASLGYGALPLHMAALADVLGRTQQALCVAVPPFLLPWLLSAIPDPPGNYHWSECLVRARLHPCHQTPDYSVVYQSSLTPQNFLPYRPWERVKYKLQNGTIQECCTSIFL